MCGRYTFRRTWKQLHRLMQLTMWPDAEITPRFNIAPTQDAPVVRAGHDGAREGAWMRWGLVPFWAKDEAIGNRMINARSETVAEKPAYRAAFKRRRCLVPACGFYEWQKLGEGKRKQPFYFHPTDGEVFAFAGLWERWDKGEGGALETFTILTTSANDTLRPVHDRMPVILAPDDWPLWLDPSVEDASRLQALLAPAPADSIEAYPVSTRVNSPANEDPACIEPLEAE